MTCEQNDYIQKCSAISLSVEDALEKLRVRKRLLHPDGMGGVVVGPEKIRKKKARWNDFVLLDMIDVKSDRDCWNWRGATHGFGYGQIHIVDYSNNNGGRPVHVHRIVWSLLFGAIPSGLVIRHKCDNPSCCNPFHLEPGTDADTMHDKIKRGRANYDVGDETWNRKLWSHQIPSIRRLAASGVPQRKIAALYNVCVATINQVLTGKTWTCVR